MSTACPKDEHGRSLDVTTRRLSCGDKGCRCAECHRTLTVQEARDWARE